MKRTIRLLVGVMLTVARGSRLRIFLLEQVDGLRPDSQGSSYHCIHMSIFSQQFTLFNSTFRISFITISS